MKDILVLFTGGTIGSVVNGNIINVDKDKKFSLIDAYQKSFGNADRFECRQVMNILSENISGESWSKLIEVLSDINFDDYKGIIITHGSDTLAFTSALLAMYFRHAEIPIFIIASNKPIGEKGSNGLYNFSAAVTQIDAQRYRGVFTLYEKVYMPTRLMPADTYCDRFSSYGDNGTSPNGDFYNITDKMLRSQKKQIFHSNISFTKNVLLIHGYPCMNFDSYNLDSKPACVLYVPYHSGTGCTDISHGEEYSLIAFIEKCIIRGIMVYICGLKKSEMNYVTLSNIIKAGSIPLYNINYVSAYAKLMLAYNQNEYKVKNIMSKNLYFEIV